MRIEFKKIEISNFMCFADETFEFPTKPGLNLICGKNLDIPGSKNGTGKSTLAAALCYALYGQTTNDIANANIHNKYVPGKEMRVVLYLAVDNDEYKIASGFNKGGSPYCNIYSINNGEETDITKSSIAESRKFIANEMIHCDVSMFMRTVMLSTDQNYNFFRLRKGEKKEFIEKLFDISVFGDMYTKIHRDILSVDKTILAHQNRLMVLNNSSQDYLERIKKYNEDKESRVAILNESMSSLQNSYNELKNKNVTSNSTETQKYEEAIKRIEDLLDDTRMANAKIDSDITKLRVALGKLSASKDSKQKMIDKHSELMSKLCQDCAKTFADYYNISTYIEEISGIDAKIAKITSAIDSNTSARTANDTKLAKLQEKLAQCKAKIKSLTEEFVKTQTEMQKIEHSIIVVERDIKRITTEANPYSELYEKNKSELEATEAELNAISDQYRYLKIAENIVSQDTLRKFIIADLIGLLNNKIKYYLSKFGAKFSVVFDADMNYEFITAGGKYEYDSFSSGERARLMIAACFAFRDFMHIRNNFSSNILILDEFIDGAIDSLAIEAILDILKDFSQNWNQNIFVVSHRKEIGTDAFNRVIQMQKKDNISKIVLLEGF